MKQMPVSGIGNPTENVHLATGVTDRFVRPRFIKPPICGPPAIGHLEELPVAVFAAADSVNQEREPSQTLTSHLIRSAHFPAVTNRLDGQPTSKFN